MGIEDNKNKFMVFNFIQSFLTKNGKILIKKSYLCKTFKEVNPKILELNGVFTTMWIYGKPQKFLFFKSHINNLINSLKFTKFIKKGIKKLIELIKKI